MPENFPAWFLSITDLSTEVTLTQRCLPHLAVYRLGESFAACLSGKTHNKREAVWGPLNSLRHARLSVSFNKIAAANSLLHHFCDLLRLQACAAGVRAADPESRGVARVSLSRVVCQFLCAHLGGQAILGRLFGDPLELLHVCRI